MMFTALMTVLSLAAAVVANPIPSGTVNLSAMNPQATGGLTTCNGVPFQSSTFKCFNGNLLCPIAIGFKGRQQLIPCGSEPTAFHCFSPDEFVCNNGNLFPLSNGAAATGSGFAAPTRNFMVSGTGTPAATGNNFAMGTGGTVVARTNIPDYTPQMVPTDSSRLMYN